MSSFRSIYTRRGDQGETRLLSGERVGKDDIRVKTYGAVEELQSHLGLARALTGWETIREVLRQIQTDLMVVGAELATTPVAQTRLKQRIDESRVRAIENWIDQFSHSYGLPRSFVIPGRDPASAAIHVARAVCRRCERLLVVLSRQAEGCALLIQYFNRLGDLLFVLAWVAELHWLVTRVVEDLLREKFSRNRLE